MRYTSTGSVQICLKFLRLAFVTVTIAFASQNSHADEMPEGMKGWWYFISAYELGYAPDAVTACKRMAKNHMNKELLDIRFSDDTGITAECNYLHAFSAVNELRGPQWYATTTLRCRGGYLPRSPGVCVKQDEPRPPSSCIEGTPGFAVGNPVTVSSGAKVQNETDFAGTRAGALQITRTYRPFSQFISGQSAGTNWSFSFDRLLTIQRWSSDGRPLNILGTVGDTSHFSFFWNADKAVYESTLDKTATLVPLTANYDEWLMVKSGRADRFKKLVSVHDNRIVRYRLISSQDINGGIQHYSYHPHNLSLSTIADEHGRLLTVDWGPYAVSSISGAEGSVKYSYDWQGLFSDHEIPYTRRLLAVEFFDPSGVSVGRRQYHYEDKFNRYFLTGITDENGKRFSTYAYDSAGRTLSSEHADGSYRFTFAYPDDNTRVVTDPSGARRTIGIRRFGGVGVSTGSSQPGGSGCSAAVSGITHDGNGNIESQTDFNGVKTCFVHDSARGLETRRVSGLARADFCPPSDDAAIAAPNIRQIRTRWHPMFALHTAVAEPKRITTYLYHGQRDAKGALADCGVSVTLANGEPLPRLCKKYIQPTTDLDGKAGFSARSVGPARVWTYAYDTDGKLVTQTGPSDGYGHAEKETRVYYEDTGASHTAGDLATVSNAAGETTHYLEYSLNGLPTKVRLPNGLTATLRYGPRQHLLSMELEDGNGVVERSNYEYDSVGNLVRITSPDGSAINYGYDDAHRLTHLFDDAGNRIQFTLDSAGNAVLQEVFDKSGELRQRLTRSYDVLNRLQREQTALDNTGTRFEYDPNGNLTKVIDELGRTTALKYDAFNRIVHATKSSPATATTNSVAYSYDHQDELLSVKDPRGLVTKYTVDGFGDLTSVKSPDTGTTLNTLDSAGRLQTVTDARGSLLRFEYDAAGRITRYANNRYEYGATGTTAAGKLVKMNDDSGRTTFGYDGFGRLVTTTQLVAAGTNPQLFNLSYTYGSKGAGTGHVTSITYPSGNRVDITYGSDGRPYSLSLDAPDKAAPVNLIEGITYRPFGDVAGWSWGNSTSSKSNIYARKFDLDGRIVSFPLGHPGKNGVTRTIGYDTVDRITHTQHAGTTTASALDQRYFYDGLDRLTGFDAANVSHGFSYDKNGNRSAARFGGATYKYTTSSASNRLNSTTGPAPAKVNTYDAAGNLTSDGTIQYSYASSGRLQSALAGGINTTYHYNGLGQRVAKSEQKRLIAHYVYDDQGRLLGEYDGTGQPVQETIYLGDLPIAVVTPAQGSKPPGIHYIYTDHLQTPRVITRASDNTMVWRWDEADPFGLYQPNENPSGVGTFTYNPRFPGQVFDKETNNHYNYFRDYDPQTGRYVQSDPIGLMGGHNTYTYVGGNPLMRSDPFGLLELPAIPQGVVDFSVGIADAASLGLGPIVRDGIDVDGGVDKCSSAYGAGQLASLAFGGGRVIYGGLAAGGAKIAANGAAALRFRNVLKRVMRGPLAGVEYRIKTYRELLERYGSDAAVKAAAGRTNPSINAIGINLTVGSGTGIGICGCRK